MQGHLVPPGSRHNYPNLLVRNNFAKFRIPGHKTESVACNHCGWRRALHTTSCVNHLKTCSVYQRTLPEEEQSDESKGATPAMATSGHQDPTVQVYQLSNQSNKRRMTDGPDGKVPAWTQCSPPATASGPATPITGDTPAPASREVAMLESVLGMVWQALEKSGSSDARTNGPLWNLVATHAPNVVGVQRPTATAVAPAQSRPSGGAGSVYETPGHLASAAQVQYGTPSQTVPGSGTLNGVVQQPTPSNGGTYRASPPRGGMLPPWRSRPKEPRKATPPQPQSQPQPQPRTQAEPEGSQEANGAEEEDDDQWDEG